MKIFATLILILVAHACAFENFASAGGTPFAWPAGQPIAWQVPRDAPKILRASVRAALEAWRSASGDTLAFQEHAGKERLKNGIVFEWNKKDHTEECASTQLVARGENLLDIHEISRAFIVVNARDFEYHRGAPVFQIREKRKARVDLDTVILHEIGHALGLTHPEHNPAFVLDRANAPTMYGALLESSAVLNADDIRGIRFLYPKPALQTFAKPEPRAKEAAHGHD